MPINKRVLGLVRKELHEQRAGLGLCKTLNPDGVTAYAATGKKSFKYLHSIWLFCYGKLGYKKAPLEGGALKFLTQSKLHFVTSEVVTFHFRRTLCSTAAFVLETNAIHSTTETDVIGALVFFKVTTRTWA